jgi:hypothetical protein
MNKVIFALAGTVLSAAPLLADGVDKSQVPADTPFLVHLDLEGLLSSTIGKIILEEMGDELLSESGLSEIEDELGINPLKDIKSITVFSSGGSMEHGVALVRCTAQIEKAFERLHEEEEVRIFEEGGYKLHAIDDAVTYLAKDGDERILLLSDDVSQVVKAAAVLHGEGKNLANNERSSLKVSPMNGAFLFLEVGGALEEMMDDGPASILGKMAKSFSLQVGEDDGDLVIRAEIETENEVDAGKVSSVLQGFQALATMVGEEIPSFARDLIGSISLRTRGNRVRGQLSVPVKGLLEMLEGLEDF